MRRFQDREGRDWEVVVGRESWGAFFAIFVPRGHDAGVRQSMLDAGSQEEAARELDGLGRDGLRELLGESSPKELG